MAVLSSLSSLLYNYLLYRNGLYISPLLIKISWQGILLYSTLYTSAPAIQQFTIQLFTIQEWTSFTPGRVILCIVLYAVLLQPLSSLLYNNLLLIKYSWQGLLLYSVLLYSALSTLLLAGLYKNTLLVL